MYNTCMRSAFLVVIGPLISPNFGVEMTQRTERTASTQSALDAVVVCSGPGGGKLFDLHRRIKSAGNCINKVLYKNYIKQLVFDVPNFQIFQITKCHRN